MIEKCCCLLGKTGGATLTAPAGATTAAAGKGVSKTVANLGVLYAETCRTAHGSVVQSAQALQSIRSALTGYLRGGQPQPGGSADSDAAAAGLGPVVLRFPTTSYECADAFVGEALPLLSALCDGGGPAAARALAAAGAVSELFGSNLKRGPDAGRSSARRILTRLAQHKVVAVHVLLCCVQDLLDPREALRGPDFILERHDFGLCSAQLSRKNIYVGLIDLESV